MVFETIAYPVPPSRPALEVYETDLVLRSYDRVHLLDISPTRNADRLAIHPTPFDTKTIAGIAEQSLDVT